MKEFWDQRYANSEYAYGKKPNEFFRQEIEKLASGKLLLPAEGEGRNAVFAATLGWQVVAFDISIEGKKKAELLAKSKGVSIDYQLCAFQNFKTKENQFDCIALIFAHGNPELRNTNHQLVTRWLKPGGTVILQGFSKEQLGNKSGGPQNIQMLFNKEELFADFGELKNLEIEEATVQLDEGRFHNGQANVINLTGTK